MSSDQRGTVAKMTSALLGFTTLYASACHSVQKPRLTTPLKRANIMRAPNSAGAAADRKSRGPLGCPELRHADVTSAAAAPTACVALLQKVMPSELAFEAKPLRRRAWPEKQKAARRQSASPVTEDASPGVPLPLPMARQPASARQHALQTLRPTGAPCMACKLGTMRHVICPRKAACVAEVCAMPLSDRKSPTRNQRPSSMPPTMPS
mmetsp:Transcript_64001/g.164725  ORF Transcript_64001/g.164725 Transcript_64001/m.164725 type:complete len:208 (-) Transcript_64001:311-934(-)